MADLASSVGEAFVEEYYNALHSAPSKLFRYYKVSGSSFSHGVEGAGSPPVCEQAEIRKAIDKLQYRKARVHILQVDCQKAANGVLLQVIGWLFNGDADQRKFCQTILLERAEATNSYHIANDIFRFLKDIDEEDVPLAAPVAAAEPAKAAPKASKPAAHMNGDHAPSDAPVATPAPAAEPAAAPVAAAPAAAPAPAAATNNKQSPKKGAEKKAGATSWAARASTAPAPRPAPAAAPAPVAAPAPAAAAPVAAPVSAAAPATGNAQQQRYSIFVRQLPTGATEDELKAVFAEMGAVNAKIAPARNPGPDGEQLFFGFVDFPEPGMVAACLVDERKNSFSLSGMTLSIEERKPQAPRIGGGGGNPNRGRGGSARPGRGGGGRGGGNRGPRSN